jgi:hypothetical protein
MLQETTLPETLAIARLGLKDGWCVERNLGARIRVEALWNGGVRIGWCPANATK